MEVSIFRNFWDKQPVKSTLDETVEAIRSDERTKELTLGYRQQKRDILKNESMLFAVPCIFEGGKAQKNVVRLTGVSMVDFDHISLTPAPSPRRGENSQLDNLRMKIVADPHTLLCYTTISGEGIRVLFRYELDDTYELKQQIQFYKKAFMTGNAYYERLIGAKADGQCKNVTRLSVVAHDAEVYYNPDAEAFTAEWIDSEWEQMQQPMKENRKLNRELARIRALYAKTIRPEVESEGAVYAPGNHNDYVMRVGYRLNQFGFSLASATEWAVSEFADYDRTADILKAAVTMPSIDERAAYAHFHEQRMHIASFCGTGNNVQFLSDPTGNRRWLPFEIEHISNPREHPFNYEGIYSQAYQLYKNGFQFWFTKEEITRLTEHNRQFETPRLEHELVQLYFRKPGEHEAGEFMSVALALQIVGVGITQKLSTVALGRAFVEQGYERKTYRNTRGYIVMRRSADEMRSIRYVMAHEATSETAKQTNTHTDDTDVF